MRAPEQESNQDTISPLFAKARGRVAVAAAVAVSFMGASSVESSTALSAEAEPSCDVSSLVFMGTIHEGHPYARFYGNSNCRNVMHSVLGRPKGEDKTWYRWDIDVDGRHIVRKGGPITQIRLPDTHAEISASYTIGYDSATSTKVEFNPAPTWPESDTIISQDTPITISN